VTGDALPSPGLPRSEAVVDLSVIAANVRALRAAAPTAQVMTVVKADAYGHGLVPVARAAVAAGASWLGTAFLAEAMALREAGLEVPILAWLHTPGEDLGAAVARGIDIGVSSVAMLEAIVGAVRSTGTTARVHLEVDTGMGRAGATAADWPDLIAAAAAASADGSVHIAGMWSHLAWADEPAHPHNARQLEAFTDAVAEAAAVDVRPDVLHLANSAATLTAPQTHFDLVRTGIATYGLSPGRRAPASAYGLVPAMTLRTHLALTKRVAAGEGVSYNHRYVTERETTLGLVPLGYADGVPRHATNTAEVLLRGTRRRIAGTVCMDQFVVDADDDDIAAGDEVVLFGSGADGEPTADDWAAALGTIGYEIVTRVGARVPRTYLPIDE
jgi:alanine racemase